MADATWTREDYGGSNVFFTRKDRNETTTVYDDEGDLWIEINDHYAGQGCGHTVAISSEMLAALGWTRTEASAPRAPNSTT